MICRSARCGTPGKRGSDGRTRAGDLIERNRCMGAPIRHPCSVASVQNAGGCIEFLVSFKRSRVGSPSLCSVSDPVKWARSAHRGSAPCVPWNRGFCAAAGLVGDLGGCAVEIAPPRRNLALSTRPVVRLRRRIHHYRGDRNGQPYPAPWTRFAGDVALCAVAQPERLSSRRRRRRTSFVTHLLPPTRSDRAPAGVRWGAELT